eukprot:403369129
MLQAINWNGPIDDNLNADQEIFENPNLLYKQAQTVVQLKHNNKKLKNPKDIISAKLDILDDSCLQKIIDDDPKDKSLIEDSVNSSIDQIKQKLINNKKSRQNNDTPHEKTKSGSNSIIKFESQQLLINQSNNSQWPNQQPIHYKQTIRKSNTNLYVEELTKNINKFQTKNIMNNLKQVMVNIYQNDPFMNEDFIISDSYVEFSVKRFIKYYFYHLLFQMVLGPLSVFILRLFDNFTFLRNMGFYGFHYSFYFQISQYIPFIVAVGIYASVQGSDNAEYLDSTELWMALVVLFLRCFIVAIRYATTINSRLECQSEREFTGRDNEWEFLGAAWRDIQPVRLDIEIKHSMIRNEVENHFFAFKFLIKINDEYKNRFSSFHFYESRGYDAEKDRDYLIQFYNQLKEDQNGLSMKQSMAKSQKMASVKKGVQMTYLEMPEKQDLFQNFPGRLVIKEFVLATKHLANTTPRIFYRFIGYLHGFLPFLINLYNDVFIYDYSQEDLQSKYLSPYFWTYTACLWYLNILTYGVNLEFLRIAIIDMKRRLFSMRICENILEPNKYKIKGIFKIFPLINYFDPETLLSWMDMRQIMLDIGKRFTIRIEYYIKVYLIFYAFATLFYLLWFFEVFQIELSATMVAMGTFEILNHLIMLYLIFYNGAMLNDIQSQQLLRICELRNIMERLKVDWERIIKCSQFEGQLLNNTFRHSLNYFGHIYEDQGPEKCVEIIKNSIDVLEVIAYRLEKEIELNPITMLGIPLNRQIIAAMQTSVLSLIAAMINKKTQIIG